jgi:type IX secretion system PorP/SprF family membrane protein
MFKKIIISTFIFVFAFQAKSQDIHFSQFYASPLNLNPALTGKVNGNYRISGIYRGQWWGNFEQKTFVTPSVSFDMPFLIGKKKQDAIGAGINVVADRTNGGRFNTTGISLSVAYHKGLGKQNKHQLSLGVQAGYVMRQLKSNDFTFGDQITNGQLNGNPTTESFANNNNNYLNLNVGLFYNGQLAKKLMFFAGYSANNLTSPSEEFLANSGNELPIRNLVHGGLQWDVAPKFSLYPGVLFQLQQKAQEVNFGNNFGWHFLNKENKKATLFFGGWYRLGDAAIAMLGLEYNRFRVGASYDFTVSDLNNANNLRGGFEVSLTYVGLFSKPTDNNIFLFCPRY